MAKKSKSHWKNQVRAKNTRKIFMRGYAYVLFLIMALIAVLGIVILYLAYSQILVTAL